MSNATKSSRSPAKKSSAKKSSASKKSSSRESAQEADACWPGYKPVAGKKHGEKGSCVKKEHQTGAERKADGRAAAASKLEKAGGSKAKANRS